MKLFLLILFFSLTLSASINPYFPKKEGNIIDQENLLSQNVKNDINFILQDHQKRKSNQIIVVILKSLNDYKIEDYAIQLKQYWKLEDKNVLVLISMQDKQIEINVSNELKNKVNNEILNEIIEFTIKPNFKAKQYELGTLKAINEIILALQYEYVQKNDKTNFSTNNFTLFITSLFLLVVFFSLFVNSISQKTKKLFIYKISKSLLYSSFFGFITFFIFKEYTQYYLIIFIGVFIFVFLLCYFLIKEFSNFSLIENSKENLNAKDFVNSLTELETISKDKTLIRKEFLKQQQGKANGNW